MHRSRAVMMVAFLVLVACNEERVEQTSSAVSSGAAPRTRCAVVNPGDAEADVVDDAAALAFGAPKAAAANDLVRIKVHVHVITTSDGVGNVSAQVPAQIDVLNTAFAVSRFRFTLASVAVIANDTWFFSEIDSPEEADMKAHLRRGGAKALNIYTNNGGGGYLGWATFPKWYAGDPKGDGVVLYHASLPGSGFAFEDPAEPDGVINYGAGDTGTHEVGHWLGLFHTFEGGCTGKGDRIDDTPAEAEPQFYCIVRDSCTGNANPGFDPITNYMDYVDDDCMFQFTTDQNRRMHRQWTKYRE
jgi:Pregnancy-associated plasma protein-A